MALCCVATGVIACVPPPLPASSPRPAWLATEDEVAAIRGLCVLPLQSESSVDSQRLGELEAILLAALRYHGFEAVDPETSLAAYDRVRRESGGFYDPLTGERDSARFEAFQDALARRLGPELGCQGFLLPRIVFVTAPWHSGLASWDGAREKIPGGASLLGRVAALSLWVSIRSFGERVLYFRAAGIQLTARLQQKGFFSTPQFEPIPPGELLRDDGRFRTAVRAALASLGSRGSPQREPPQEGGEGD